MAYPQFKAPEWQTSRISALRQKFAAPQVGRLKRQMGGMMGMGYDPQSVQARRATIRGYGEGLGGIMAGAGQTALSQYGQEYGAGLEAKKLEYGAELGEKEREWERGPGYEYWKKHGRGAPTGGGLAGGGGFGGIGRQRGGPVSPGGMHVKTSTGGRWVTRQQYEDWYKGRQYGTIGKQKQAIREPLSDITERASRVFGIAPREEHIQRWPQQGGREVYGPYHSLWRRLHPESAQIPARRQKGGPVYSVGEGGTPSKPRPELVVYNGGRMELVGERGPEVRTFPEEGEVIPAGKTNKIMKGVTKRKRGGKVEKHKQTWAEKPYRLTPKQRLHSPGGWHGLGLEGMPNWLAEEYMKRGFKFRLAQAKRGPTVIRGRKS